MERTSYFASINLIGSPLLLLPAEIDKLFAAIANDSPHSTNILLSFAEQLGQMNNDSAKARAAFIKLQCGGVDTEDLFEHYREGWGIPIFKEELVTVNDFKNGFFWTFRDHSGSWSEDNEARNWFYTHIEARFARR